MKNKKIEKVKKEVNNGKPKKSLRKIPKSKTLSDNYSTLSTKPPIELKPPVEATGVGPAIIPPGTLAVRGDRRLFPGITRQ